MTEELYDFVVIGGGIAAVCCVEQLANLDENTKILILSASKIVKSVSNVQKIGREMESFDVAETSGEILFRKFKNVTITSAFCSSLNVRQKVVISKDGQRFRYDRLCVATGGTPKLLSNNPNVIGIRDTETVKDFQKRLSNASRIVVVGNGGIATELVYEVKNVEVVWVVKHKSISHTFIDAGAAEFFLSHLHDKPKTETVSRRLKYTHAESSVTVEHAGVKGSALGPDWIEGLDVSGVGKEGRHVHIEFECEVDKILKPCDLCDNVKPKLNAKLPVDFSKRDVWPVYVQLTNGNVVGCDFIVSATGVTPSFPLSVENGENFVIAEDGGILVDSEMRTNVPCVYAAGDVCTAGWKWSPHWIQMRLWTQARQMGSYAGRCMFNDSKNVRTELDMCFEIFTHVTNFFGFKVHTHLYARLIVSEISKKIVIKVILLGKFNSQDLRPDHIAHVRIRKGEEYVKVLIQDGKVQGAILIGETELEETFENIILNGIDVSHLGDDLLNSTVDIEDYFD